MEPKDCYHYLFYKIPDGNLVLYDATKTRVFWATNTYPNSGAYLVLQDDGNMVMFNSLGKTIWATNTLVSCSSKFKFN